MKPSSPLTRQKTYLSRRSINSSSILASSRHKSPLKNYIVEPDIALDRGPGEGLAFLYLSVLFPDEPVFYVQADMVREPGEKFIEMIQAAEKIVTETGKYITGGVKATEANMGDGSILDVASARN